MVTKLERSLSRKMPVSTRSTEGKEVAPDTANVTVELSVTGAMSKAYGDGRIETLG
jgi:hypothetical protein